MTPLLVGRGHPCPNWREPELASAPVPPQTSRSPFFCARAHATAVLLLLPGPSAPELSASAPAASQAPFASSCATALPANRDSGREGPLQRRTGLRPKPLPERRKMRCRNRVRRPAWL